MKLQLLVFTMVLACATALPTRLPGLKNRDAALVNIDISGDRVKPQASTDRIQENGGLNIGVALLNDKRV